MLISRRFEEWFNAVQNPIEKYSISTLLFRGNSYKQKGISRANGFFAGWRATDDVIVLTQTPVQVGDPLANIHVHLYVCWERISTGQGIAKEYWFGVSQHPQAAPPVESTIVFLRAWDQSPTTNLVAAKAELVTLAEEHYR